MLTPVRCAWASTSATPAISEITTASVDTDGDCRDDAATTCYTAGVLSTDSDAHYYGDREYVMTEIPEFMVGMHFIRTANDDKRADATDLDFLCFHVDMRAVVFVLYDSRATSLPEWLSSVYTDQHVQALMTTDTGMVEGFEIYYSDVEAGQVCMGGNGVTGAGSNYVVVIGPPVTASTSATPSISEITTASVDTDGDCRDDAATACYTAGVLSTDSGYARLCQPFVRHD